MQHANPINVVPSRVDNIDNDVKSFEMIDNITAQNKLKGECHMGLMCQEAHKLYVTSTHDRQVVNTDGKHSCHGGCTLMNIPFSTFSIGTDVHVCVGAGMCTAPAEFHSKFTRKYDRVLFICKETNVMHICTENTCDAEKIDKDTFSCCSLTGNVHSKSSTLLSHGWIEDDWRKGVSFKVVDSPDVLSSPAEPKSLLKLLGHDNVTTSGTDTDARHCHLRVALSEMAKIHIIPLLPGSVEQIAMIREQNTLQVYSFLDATEKYILACIGNNTHVAVPHIHSMLRTVTESGLADMIPPVIQMDAHRIDAVASAYAKSTVDFICTLVLHSCFKASEYRFRDTICALLYMQRSNFTIHGTTLITADPILTLLPSVAKLRVFGFDNNLFTRIKNRIQYCIVDAIDSGIDPVLLRLPIVSVTDTLIGCND